MSKCAPKNQELINRIKNLPWKVSDYSVPVKCYYDASPYCTKRDYVLEFEDKYWTGEDTYELKRLMRKAGATDIIGGIRRGTHFIDIAFDEKEER